MQPQPNLDLNPTPSSTSAPLRMPSSPRHVAVGFVFSLTLASSLHPDIHLYRKLTLLPVNCIGLGSTCTASIIRDAVLPDPAIVDPLDALLKEVHAQVSEEGWSKMPANFSGDVDGLVYGV